MPASEQPSSYAERLAAMNLLRENLFYASPGKYSFTDIAEDLPGSARSVAPIVKNVLPSAAIISSDPEERKKQIVEALKRIKRSGGANSDLGKEMLHNAATMGGGALTAGFLLSAATRLLGWKGLKGLNAAGEKVFQNPFQLSRNIARLSSKKNYANALLRRSGYDALTGAGLAAGAGMAYPAIEHANPSKNQALIEAANIIQDQPYITSLPGGEAVSVMRSSDDHKDKGLSETLKNIGAGTLFGTVAGGALAIAPAAVTALGRGAGNIYKHFRGKPLVTVVPRLLNELKHEIPRAATWGAGTGAVAGALTSRLPSDEGQTATPYTPQSGRVIL